MIPAAAPGAAAPPPPPDDANGVQAAVDRYREVAKWLITVFAAVAGLLAAGSQLSSLGHLVWKDDSGRFLAAVIALAVAILAAVVAVTAAMSVLRPVSLTIDAVADDQKLAKQLNKTPRMLPLGQTTVAGVRDEYHNALESGLLTDEQEQDYRDAVKPLIDAASYLKVEGRFNASRWWMMGAAVVAAAGIGVFAWAANPPKKPPTAKASAAIADPRPARVRLLLTGDGRKVLGPVIGKACVTPTALTVGGTSAAPRVVTLASPGCRVAEFTLTQALGLPSRG